MSKLPTFLTAVNKLVSGHPICFTNSLLVILSAGGEQLFQTVAFKCPKDRELAPWYGWQFALSPLGVLLICGMVLSTRLWSVYHGCWKRDENARLTCGQPCRSFWYVFFQSLVAPSVWLFVSLLDGSYFVCIYAEKLDDDAETLRIRAKSQIYGWIWLLIVVIVGAAVTCTMRCCDRKTFLELRYSEVYKRVEEAELQTKMNEEAKALADVYVKDLFSSTLPKKETWDTVALPDSGQKYYSSLQKFYHQKSEKKSQSDNKTVVNLEPLDVEGNRGPTQ